MRRNYSAHPRFGPRVTFWASIYGVSYGDSISANKSYLDALSSVIKLSTEVRNHIQTASIHFQPPSKWGSVKKAGRIHENLWCTPCVVSWRSAATAHIPADLRPLKRYGTCAQFWLYLFEITHKKDALDPLSSLVNLTNEVGNHTPTRLVPLSTRPKTVRVEITRLDSLSRVLKLSTVESNRTVAHDVICYSLRGFM